MSQVLSFAEESCWDGERFRSVRREIVFVVTGFQLKTAEGEVVKREFTSDFGLWYDVDDEALIAILRDLEPSIRWDWFIYHKKLDHSGIMILNPETNKPVGQIYPRGRSRQKLSGEKLAANIVPISKGVECRAARLAREEEKQARRSQRGEPEGS